jgi:hypothetical protein
MAPALVRLWGNIILGVAIILLLITLSGMIGLTPKLASSRELIPVCFVLLMVAFVLRRRGAGSAT